MKKGYFKLFAVVFAAALVLTLTSCPDLLKTGGTIEVTNESSLTTLVTITTPNLGVDPKTISAGATETWSFDDNGLYLILAVPGTASKSQVTLLGGSTEKITVRGN
jgi:hypothetical protein